MLTFDRVDVAIVRLLLSSLFCLLLVPLDRDMRFYLKGAGNR